MPRAERIAQEIAGSRLEPAELPNGPTEAELGLHGPAGAPALEGEVIEDQPAGRDERPVDPGSILTRLDSLTEQGRQRDEQFESEIALLRYDVRQLVEQLQKVGGIIGLSAWSPKRELPPGPLGAAPQSEGRS